MKIKTHDIPAMTIEQFADAHGLVMEVYERLVPANSPRRFRADFRHAEVRRGCMALGLCGFGSTAEEAIVDYAQKISMKQISVMDGISERRNIDVPRLVRM